MAILRFTEPAGVDLEEIAAFIGHDNPMAAERLLAILHEKCRLLAERPMIGRSRERIRPTLRSHPFGSYVIFYRPVTGGIEIVRVLHGARDIDAIFAE